MVQTEGSTLDLPVNMSKQDVIVPWNGKPGQEFRNHWDDMMLVLMGVIDKAQMSLDDTVMGTDQGGPHGPAMTPGAIVQAARVVRLKLALVGQTHAVSFAAASRCAN